MDFRHKRGSLHAQPSAGDARRVKGVTPSSGPVRPGQGSRAARQSAQRTPATSLQPRAAAWLHTAPHAFGSRSPVPATPRGGVSAWVVPLALAAVLHTAVGPHPMPLVPRHWMPRGLHHRGAEAAERQATPTPTTEPLAPGLTLTQSLALAELRRLGAPGVSINKEDGRLQGLLIDPEFAASKEVETYKALLRQVGYRAEDVEQYVEACQALGVVKKMPGMHTLIVRSDGSITAHMVWHRQQTPQDYEALRRLGLPTPQPPPGSVPELTRDAETLAQWSTLHRRLEQKPGVLRLFESAAAGKVPGITIGHAGNVTVNLDLPRTPRARAEAQHIQDNLVDFNTYLSLRPLIDDLRSRHSGTR
jgi:hypothetical protein